MSAVNFILSVIVSANWVAVVNISVTIWFSILPPDLINSNWYLNRLDKVEPFVLLGAGLI